MKKRILKYLAVAIAFLVLGVPLFYQAGQINSLNDQLAIYAKAACADTKYLKDVIDSATVPEMLKEKPDVWEEVKKQMLNKCDSI